MFRQKSLIVADPPDLATGAGGKPSTWFPPGGLVEHTHTKQRDHLANKQTNGIAFARCALKCLKMMPKGPGDHPESLKMSFSHRLKNLIF